MFDAMFVFAYDSFGPAGMCDSFDLSNCDPYSGCGSFTSGGPCVVPVVPSTAVYVCPFGPCLTHCVSPDCPAIIAIAFGVEGVSSVAKMLSKIVKLLAQFQKNGIVSQSMCDMTRRANWVPSAAFAAPPFEANRLYSSDANWSICAVPFTTLIFFARPVCEWSTLSTTLEFCVGPIRNGVTVTVAPLTSVYVCVNPGVLWAERGDTPLEYRPFTPGNVPYSLSKEWFSLKITKTYLMFRRRRSVSWAVDSSGSRTTAG